MSGAVRIDLTTIYLMVSFSHFTSIRKNLYVKYIRDEIAVLEWRLLGNFEGKHFCIIKGLLKIYFCTWHIQELMGGLYTFVDSYFL